MGIRRIASGNPTLTNFAAGLSPDFSLDIAGILAPMVTTPSTIGQFKRFDDVNSFQVVDTSRAIGGTARRLEFFATDPTFNAQPQALEIPLDDAELDAEGNFSISVLQGKTKALLSQAQLSHADKVITKAKTQAAVAVLGAWGDATVDPVAEVDACLDKLSTDCGQPPNRIVFGLTAWQRFRNHAKVRARQPGAVLIGLTTLQAASLFLIPGIRIEVATLSKNTAKPGNTVSKTKLLGDDVFIFIGSDSPTQYDPSWMKTFGPRGGVDAVRTYRDERSRSDILALDWAEDIQIVSALACNRITTAG